MQNMSKAILRKILELKVLPSGKRKLKHTHHAPTHHFFITFFMILAIARAVEEWKTNKEQNKDQELPEEENIYPEDVSTLY